MLETTLKKIAIEVFGTTTALPFVEKGYERLRQREKEVLLQKYELGRTLEEIGKSIGGVTKERARQIKCKALEKLSLFAEEEARSMKSTTGAIQ